MFRGTPPFLRVALRHRRWAILAAPLAALTVLYCSYHPEYYRFPDVTGHGDSQTLSPFQHDVVVVQAGTHEFPDYYWDITGQPLDFDNDRGNRMTSSQRDQNYPLRLLSTTNSKTKAPFSFKESFPLPPPQPGFTPGIPKPLNEAYTKAIVIAHTQSENVDWIHDPILGSPPPFYPHKKDGQRTNTTKWIPHLYSTDEIFRPITDPEGPLRFHTPLNKGREALAYLSYIIAQYDTLPDISVFMHAHSSSWHDDQFGLDSPTTLSRLNLDRVIMNGYVNLRCWWDPGCPDHIHPYTSNPDELKPEEGFLRDAWLDLYPWRDVPPSISQPCCGQFALSRERIRSVKLAEYVRLRDWILVTELEDSVSGRVFEYVWQVIWTGYEILCPVEWVCYCEGYGICFGDEEELEGGNENEKGGEKEKRKREKGYEDYSLKRDEYMGLTQIVEDFLESEDGAGFDMDVITRFADRVENGEEVEEVVRRVFALREDEVGEEEEEQGKGGSAKEGEKGEGKEGRSRKAKVEGIAVQYQEAAWRLVEAIKASRKANKVLMPWLMDKMGKAKGEK